MTQNPTVIAASLDDEALIASVNKLVDEVNGKFDDMAKNINSAVSSMENRLKKLGDIKVSSSGASDGGSSRRAKKQEDEEKAVQQTTIAYDEQAQAIQNLHNEEQKEASYEPGTLGYLREAIEELKKKLNVQTLISEELQQQADLLKQLQNSEKSALTSTPQKELSSVLSETKGRAKSLDEAQTKLQKLVALQEKYRGTTKLSESEQTRLTNAITKARQEVEKIKSSQPKSIKEVLGMDEKSVEAITIKMRELRRVQLDSSNPEEAKKLADNYTRLQEKQRALLGQNNQLAKSNNILASSFGYIRNRIIYALTLGTLGSFVRNVREVRAEYEMLERSLGILTGSMEQGTQIFKELGDMALKSPFTLVELGTAAKQLTAYNFAANEVVDTTRRLADISAALGVPMERLTYNLGQIKAQGVLNARDARDFANAGLAIVPMLAKMYTEQKLFGDELVTTAKVYDMMSKKMVSYGDVLAVLNRLTNEGGKFYDYQAKQAETLKVQFANLTLAMNNMFNEIGQQEQGTITSVVKGLRYLFKNWQSIATAIKSVLTALSIYKAVQLAALLTSDRLWRIAAVSVTRFYHSVRYANGALAAFNALMASSGFGALLSIVGALASYFIFFRDSAKKANVEMEQFGENATKTIARLKTLQKVVNGAEKNTNVYAKALKDVNNIFEEYGIVASKNIDEVNKKIEQTISLVKQEGAERQHANMLSVGESQYTENLSNAQENYLKSLEGSNSKQIKENAAAINMIVESLVQSSINQIKDKTAEEYRAEFQKIREGIQKRLNDLKLESAAKALKHASPEAQKLWDYVKAVVAATKAYDDFNKVADENYKLAKASIDSSMSFTEKVDANKRALDRNYDSVTSLYNRIYELTKIANKNYKFNIDLNLQANNVPKWMMQKSSSELSELAKRFTAIAESGGHAEGYTRETTMARGLLYSFAAIQKEAEENRHKDDDKKPKTDKILKALKDEISLVERLQSDYEKLTKAGATANDALNTVKSAYGSTIDLLNKQFAGWGLPQLDLSIITGKNPMEQIKYFKSVLDVLKGSKLGNLERIKAVEVVLEKLNVKAKEYNLDMVTKGLNNELGKLKEEYEIGVEFDANPELGNVFADMMGFDASTLPKTYSQVLKKAQQEIDKILKEGDRKEIFDLSSLLNKSDFDDWVKNAGLDANSELVKILNDFRVYVNKVRLDEKKETIKSWSSLVDKYGEINAKIVKIYKDSVKEQIDLIREFGDDDDIEKALDLVNKINISQSPEDILRLQKELSEVIAKVTQGNDAAIDVNAAIENEQRAKTSKAYWEDFKNTDLYSMLFDDMANNSTRAINAIIEKMELLRDKVKDDPASMKALIKSLNDAQNELEKRNPFLTIKKGMDEMANGIKGLSDTRKKLKTIAAEIKDAQDELKKAKESQGTAKEEYDRAKGTEKEAAAKKKLEDSTKEVNKLETSIAAKKKEQEGYQKSQITFSNMIKKGQKDVLDGAKAYKNNLEGISNAISSVADVFSMLGDDDTAESLNDINKGFQVMIGIIGAVIAIMLVLEATAGPIILALSAAMGLFIGLASLFEGAQNRKINRQIKESEALVRKLELAYKDLEAAIEDAYGAEKYGLTQAELANKQLQLAEAKRQLQLEQSRKAKHYDQEKIDEYKEKVKDLENEIKSMTNDVVKDMLGISSVGNAAEELVSNMIQAFREGEDYMQSYKDSFDDMINNMIVKAIASRVIGDRIQAIFDEMQSIANTRGKDSQQMIEYYTQKLAEHEYALDSWIAERGSTSYSVLYDYKKEVEAEIARMKAIIAQDKENLEKYTQAYADATRLTPEDVESVRNQGEAFKDDVKSTFEAMMSAFGIKFGEGADSTSLSNLQQGISAITEDTAGAIEAYLNGVSQQVYLHSDLLTQIRDAVVGFDMDVQLATQAQILMQLQASYQVQMSIQSTLQGWSNASGMAVRVEMV